MARAGLTPILQDTSQGQFLRDDGVWADLPGGGGDISAAWPVGSVFISVVSTNPATLLGFGTWVELAAGRMLVGLDAGQVEFDTVRKSGGAKAATLTVANLPAHNHAVADPGHTHGQSIRNSGTAGTAGTQGASAANTATAGTTASATTGIATQNTGSGAAFSTLSPYFVVTCWERVS